jgi:hypothetical protein
MKKKQVLPNIYLVEFDTTQEAAMTFMRFQEHYESPKFRNKIFTREEYIKWYQRYTNKPNFTYYQDWTGFNIPSYVLLPFFSGGFTDFTRREREFLSLFKKCTGQYYIIGIKKGQSNTLKHELMHALYYTNPKYRQSVERILDSGPSLLPISIYIKNLGYHNEVLRDETHAYLVTCQDNLKKAAINFDIYKPIIKLLNTNYKKYSKS